MNRIQLLSQARKHYHSYEQILFYQRSNFKDHLLRNQHELKWWLGDAVLEKIEDIDNLPIRTPLDIIEQQLINPPYGMWSKREMVFTSSGSTNNHRKVFPRSWEDYLRYLIGVVRSMENYGVNHDDTVMTTDSRGVFTGHIVIEDAAIHILGAPRIRCNSTLPTERLQMMEQFGVTVFSGSPTKLLTMAKLEPKKHLSRPLKMVISTGSILTNTDEISDAFGVNHVTDMYGSTEMGNIAWTCNQGNFHVNIDLCYIEQGRYFSNLSNLPLLRYEQGEELYFSHKGTCACGSNLPTMDRFVGSTIDRRKK